MTVFDPESDKLPKLSELEPIPGAPKYAAWFWGKDDELGRLNLLTPRRIAKAGKLIQTGETVCLNYPAEYPYPTFFNRAPFVHTVKQVAPNCYDDLYSLNTQSGSQWDGFRHVGIENNDSFVWYNNTTQDQIDHSTRIGIQAWAKRGIVGRGVLIDFYEFAKKSYDPFSHRKITADEIKACAKAQNVTFEYGDILIVRTGWSEKYSSLDAQGRKEEGAKGYLEHQFSGLDRGHDMVELLHDNYFAAVASDAPAFESWPMDEPEHLHHFLLPLWGSPIGELWDVDGLSELCKKHNRYTFFFTSAPANVQGGVGSHPNAVALF